MSRVILIGLISALCCVPTTFAQAVSGSINGYITDSSGSPISGATVSIVNENTGVKTEWTTNTDGFYNAISLLPGQYSISSEARGFSKLTREHVTLDVDATVRVDLKLAIGQLSESITVSASAELLQAEKVDVSQTFNEQQVQQLPTVGRNITQLYLDVPGTMPDSFSMGPGENPSGGVRTYVNGTWSGQQEFILDGITDRSYGFSGIQLIVPPQDSVQELKITTADYDPEFGSTGGMVAQFVTKSGTNDVHGSLFYFNQNSATFAANPLTEKIAGTGPNGTGTGVPPYNWNEGGFSLGGPLKKNKLFLFGDYQLTRQIQGASLIATAPNAAFRSGDFSNQPYTIYDPNTGNPDGTARTPFAGNMIPSTRINPVATNLLDLLPMPNINQGTDNNFVGSEKQTFNQNWADTRADWNISETDKFFVRYSYFSTFLDNPPLFGEVAGGPAQGGLSPEIANTSAQQAAMNYTHSFTPNLLAEFRAGYVRFNLYGLQDDSKLQTDNAVGIPGINTGTPITGGLAGISVGGPAGSFTMGIPSGVGIPRFDTENTFEYVSNWSMIKQDHQLRWGADFRRYQFDFSSVNSSTRGNYNFCQTVTGSPSDPNSGLAMATFLLGDVCSFDRAVLSAEPAERQSDIGLYAQDIWRLTPKLTLNYGLRWDKFTPVTSPFKGGLANFDPSTGDILLAGVGSVSDSVNVKSPDNDFAPRLGFAYKITQNTVIRAGLGRDFFSSGYDATFYHLTSGFPIVTQQTVTQANIYQLAFSFQDTPAAAAAPPLPSSGMLPAPNDVTLKTRTLEPDTWKTETMDSWNFTIQQALGHGATFTAQYLGNKGTHLNWQPNINAANVGPGSLLDRRPYYLLYGLTQGISGDCNCSNSNYNALNLTFSKKMSNFWTLTSNFTWSKDMGYGAFWSPNTYNRSLDYGPGGNSINSGSIDRKFIWITMHTFNIPYGPGRMFGSNVTGIRKYVLGGWVFSGVLSVESGLSYTPAVSSNASLNADFQQRPDPIPGMSSSDVPGGQNAAHWFNPAAFTIPVCCQFGYASVGSLRGPGFVDADWALSKNFVLPPILHHEGTTIQIRAEAFNVWNNTNLALPNAYVDLTSAGQITNTQNNQRIMQFGAHIYF